MVDIERKRKNEEMYKIKEQIDNHIKSMDIFKLPLYDALNEILIRHSELLLFFMLGSAEKAISKKYCNFDFEERSFEQFLQESLKWGVKWCYLYCDEKSDFSRKFKLEEVIEVLEIAFAYELFFNQWNSFTKKGLDVEIEGNHIKFINKNQNESYFQAYNTWRSLKREEKTINNIYLAGASDYYSMMEMVHKSDFSISLDWSLDGYTYQDFLNFSTGLDSFLTKHNMYELEKGGNGNTIFLKMNRENSKRYIIEGTLKWWVKKLGEYCDIDGEKVKKIIRHLTYTSTGNGCEVSHQFFLPFDNKLILSSRFVNWNVRPQRNFLSLLPKINKKLFSKISNDLEYVQKNEIKTEAKNVGLLFAEGTTKEEKVRSGMDLLILDPISLGLLIIELKFSIPVHSSIEVLKVDKTIEEGVKAAALSKGYTSENIECILGEYFGEKFKGVKPTDYESLVLVNESIGTGKRVPFNAPVITIDHFLDLLNYGGVEWVIVVIRNGMRGYYADNSNEIILPLEIGGFSIYTVGYNVNFSSELL